jgi:signal transduction histidine kinase/ligand-binding sensor domain-containing protein
MKFRLAALLCLVVWVCLPLQGAQEHSAWFARQWQMDDGLPNSSVTGVAQDASGYLWVSTHSGLARFDGERFTPWPLPIDSEQSNPLVRAMWPGRNNTLWLAVEAKESLLVGLSSQATNCFRVAGDRPLVITETPHGTVWVGYAQGHVYSFSGGNARRHGARAGLSGSGGCWLATDLEGHLWFAKAGVVGWIENGQATDRFLLEAKTVRLAGARDRGIWILAGQRLLKCSDGKTAVLLGELPSPGPGVEPSVIYEDKKGGVWLGTRGGGLFHWDGQEIRVVETSHRVINCITEDREGNIWVGTDGGGLNRLRPQAFQLHGPEQGRPFETVRSVCEDNSGVIWAVGLNGELERLAGDQWESVTNIAGMEAQRAISVAADRQGGVWIATERGGLFHWQDGNVRRLDQKDGLGGGMIRSLFVDSRNDLWIGMDPCHLERLRHGVVQAFALPPGGRAIAAIAEDAAGAIWLGTLNGWLFRVNHEQVSDCTSQALQPTRPIRALHPAPEGGLWIGYGGGGLGWLRGGTFSRFGVDQGLPDDSICGIEQDSEGALWFSSSRGIFRVLESDLARVLATPGGRLPVVKFGRNDGLENLAGSHGVCPNTARGKDGQLWFATRSGLLVAAPDRVQPRRQPPAVLIERFLVDGQPQEWPARGDLRVQPAHRKLSVEFVAFNFAAPEATRFRWRLGGWDDHWSEPVKSREFTFSRLPAGRYQFEVTACDDAGEWNPQAAALSFEVEPFLWQRWWFRLAGALLGTGMIAAFVRYVSFRRLRAKVRQLELEAVVRRDRARIAQDLHDDLGSSLTEITFLGDLSESATVEPSELRARCDKIVARARQMARALDEIVWAVNPANDTLKATANYLCSRAQEYLRAGNVRCRFAVEEDLTDLPLPSDVRHSLLLALIEAVTNVMKHAQASEVWLRFAVEGEQLIVRVQDNGKGFEPSIIRDERNGLRNLQRRCLELGGKCLIDSAVGKGTTVQLILPLFRFRLGRTSQ